MLNQDVHDLTVPIESDVEVAPAQGGRPGLHVPAVIALKPGESYFYNRPLPGTVRLCDLKDEIAKTRIAIKGAAGSAIKRASDMTGLRYSQSTGEMITTDGRVVVYSMITCSEARDD
jgi:hypothetical protein